MYSPKKGTNIVQPQKSKSKGKISTSPSTKSSHDQKTIGFKPKTMTDLKPIQKQHQNSPKSLISKHQRSFSTLYSKHMQHQCYQDLHNLGYSAEEIKQSVNYIFQKYDTNKDNLLDRGEVKHLLTASLKHLGTNHAPTDLEVIEFIYSMDKNSDGKLSREQMQRAFKRANKIEY